MEKQYPKKLFVFEGKAESKPRGFDHVFSYLATPSDSWTHDYIVESEMWPIYEEEYQQMMSVLFASETSQVFSYRGVALLPCFKKALFEFAYYLRHRYEVFKLVIHRYSDHEIHLDSRHEIYDYPSLRKILRNTPLADDPRMRVYLSQDEKEKLRFKRAKPSSRFYWPSRMRVGKIKDCRHLIYSDYQKAKSVVKTLGPGSCCFYVNDKSPRMFLRALSARAALFQSGFTEGKLKRYDAKVKEFADKVESTGLFANYRMGEIEGEGLLREELKNIFQRKLGNLLHHIDALHHLCQEAKHLKSMLLDEDANPEKNASCQVARQYGITSYVESHGALGHKIGCMPLAADYLFVWGKGQKKKVVEWGIPEKQVLISGCSRYRQYVKLSDAKVKSKITKQFDLDPQKKIILIAFLPTSINRGHYEFESRLYQNIKFALKAVSSYIQKDSSVQVIAKIHPGDRNRRTYVEWAEKNRRFAPIAVVEQGDPLLIAKAADLMLAYATTYAVEGMGVHRPVISLFDQTFEILKEFRESGIFFYANTQEEIVETIQSILSGNIRSKEIQEKARKDCLNEGGEAPEKIIAGYLSQGQERTVPAATSPEFVSSSALR